MTYDDLRRAWDEIGSREPPPEIYHVSLAMAKRMVTERTFERLTGAVIRCDSETYAYLQSVGVLGEPGR